MNDTTGSSTGTKMSQTGAAGEVEAVLLGLIESWNRHDATAYAKAFAENADFVNVVGMRWLGRAQIEETHKTLHQTIFRNSVLRSVERTVRFLTADIALAHGSWEMTGAESIPGWNAPEIRRGIMTVVLIRDESGWLITALQNTDILPLAMPKP